MSGARILTGDCMALMPTLHEASVSSIVTDPPYHLTAMSRNGSPRQNDPATPFGRTRLGSADAEATRFGATRAERGFMNKTWDGGDIAFRPETWEAAGRVVRPGGYLLAFGGSRTFHRLAVAIEDGGWEIVDVLAWLYGQGFPKHPSKLKPAFEPIVMARRPGPVHNLAIDECRVPFRDAADEAESKEKNRHEDFGSGARENAVYGADNRPRSDSGNYNPPGRWPANVVVDETAARMIDEQSGDLPAGGFPGARNTSSMFTANAQGETGEARKMDAGGASRFFYCPKASRSEREAGLEELDAKAFGWSGGASAAAERGEDYDNGDGGINKTTERRNTHPTVKPIALMRWLCRLVTPPGGVVMDPFMGSGSTGAAAALEGFGFIGTELSPEYVEIARRRVIHWRPDDLFGVSVEP